MSTQVDYARIVLLNRTTRELAAANPVLLSGEAAIADVGTTNPNLRFGDGVRPWSALPAFLARGGGAGMLLAAPVVIPPGDDGTISLTVQGAPNNVATQIVGGIGNTAFEVLGAPQVAPGWYYATIHPRPNTQPQPGTSNGLNLTAGTTAGDTALLVQSVNGREFLRIRGDGSGWLGANETNSLFWNSAGQFGLRGTATLPGGAISTLSDVQLTNLVAGNTLQWSGSRWINGTPAGVVQITTGTGLTGGVITTHGTIALADTAVTPGDYTQAHITVDQQGRITHAESGIEPTHTLADLTDVSLTNPQAGQAITFDGTDWVNSTPKNALAQLTDVALDSPIPEDVLAFDGTHWANTKELHLTHLTIANDPVTEREAATKEYVDGAIAAIPPPPPPEEGITQLVQLTDVSVSGVQDGQVISWDATANRWRNRDAGGALATLADVGLTTPTVGQLLTFNGTRWANGGNAQIASSLGIVGNAASTILKLDAMGGDQPLIVGFGYGLTGGAWNVFSQNPIVIGTQSATNVGLYTAGTDRLVIGGQGNVVVNAAGSGTTFTVTGAAGAVALALQGATDALFVAGSMTVYDHTQSTPRLRLGNDGSGSIGNGSFAMTWDNWGAVTIPAGPGASQRLNIYGNDGGWTQTINGQYGLYISSTYSPIQITSATGQLFRLYDSGQGYIGPPEPDQLLWDGLGHFRFGGNWISPNNLVRTWIQGRPNEHGLYLQASTGSGLTFAAWSANNDAGRMQINNDGSVNLGIGNAIMVNNTGSAINYFGGGITMGSAPRLAISGIQNAHGMYITGAAHNATAQWLAVMTYGSNVPNDGCCNGLYIQAGSPSFNDDGLIVVGRTGTYGLRVKGNGNVCFPGIGPATASANAYLDGQRYLSIITSSGRYKRDIESLRRARAREVVSKLRAVSFRSKCEREDPTLLHYGLIAEEVAAVDPVLVTRNAEGEPQAVDYNCLSALLLTLLQDMLDVKEPEATWLT